MSVAVNLQETVGSGEIHQMEEGKVDERAFSVIY